jgi:hypothetical protein
MQVCSQQNGVISTMRGHKLQSGVNWPGALKQKDIKQG